MQDEQPFLDAIADRPHDWGPRLVLADWLDERGDARGELLRLLYGLTRPLPFVRDRPDEARLRELVEAGVPAVGPFLVDAVGVRFALVPPGTFWMGDDEGDPDEAPRRSVTLTRAYWVGVFPVTQGQWERVMGGTNPSQFQGTDLPVESLSWQKVRDEFLPRYRARTGLPARLPTEAEWEYACRAGTTTPYYSGFGEEALRKVGWCSYSGGWGTARRPRAVGVSGYANAFGLYDMHGNIYDWCDDGYRSYAAGPQTDPFVAPDPTGLRLVVRGGAWVSSSRYCRSSFRDSNTADVTSNYVGFRLVLEARG